MAVQKKSILELTADEILGIKVDNPEALFRPTHDAIKSDYRSLSMKWAPDRNTADSRASDVQSHLNLLRKSADDKLDKDDWQQAGYFTCRLTSGKKLRVRSDASHPFELGTMHISPTTVTYVVKRDYADLFENAVSVFGAFKFDDEKMKDAYAAHVPTVFKTYEAVDNLILTVKKDKEDILLGDLKPFMMKEDGAKHVAWVMSRLHELARYLNHVGVTHNAVTMDNVFVSPRDHNVGIFGGWWYAAPHNKSIKALPAAAGEFVSDETLAHGSPDPKIDLEMIRALGRELLGDRGGTKLTILKPAPAPMIDYLRMPSSGNAQKDLTHWYHEVLTESFGARRFTELPVSYSDVYQPKGA